MKSQSDQISWVEARVPRGFASYLKFFFLLTFAIFLSASAASAKDIYVAQNSTGAANGADCADALPVSWFNNSTNWGSGPNQAGPGTTLHLCGTFTGAAGTTMLTVQASGVSGSPITILFETGAVLTAPYWSSGNGAIDLSSHSYVVVDGGTNGIIQNTANGTGLTFHNASVGVHAGGTSNCEVKNLTIANLYVHTSVSDSLVDQGNNNAVKYFPPATNLTIDNNTIHDCGWCLNGYGNGLRVFGNNLYNMDHGLAMGVSSGGPFNDMIIHDNHFHDMANWDTSSNSYHHDGIHAWGLGGGTITGIMMYNNTFDGDIGNNVTGWIYLQGAISNAYIYNNFFSFTAGRTANNGSFSFQSDGASLGSNAHAYNNTVIDHNATVPGSTCVRIVSYSHVDLENNLLLGCNTLISSEGGSTFATFDNNVYENVNADSGSSNAFNFNGNHPNTLAGWRSACNCDAHATMGTAAQINVSSTGILGSGSITIGAGANLTSLGITALGSDKAGNARPGSGAWDAGAYQSGITAGRPEPPSNLRVVPH